jgi:hypothetical protein
MKRTSVFAGSIILVTLTLIGYSAARPISRPAVPPMPTNAVAPTAQQLLPRGMNSLPAVPPLTTLVRATPVSNPFGQFLNPVEFPVSQGAGNIDIG